MYKDKLVVGFQLSPKLIADIEAISKDSIFDEECSDRGTDFIIMDYLSMAATCIQEEVYNRHLDTVFGETTNHHLLDEYLMTYYEGIFDLYSETNLPQETIEQKTANYLSTGEIFCEELLNTDGVRNIIDKVGTRYSENSRQHITFAVDSVSHLEKDTVIVKYTTETSPTLGF